MNVIEVLAQESGEPGAALPHLAEIIVGFVAFAVLVYVLGRYVWPTFTRTHHDHNEKVAGGMKRAEQEQEKAQEELGRERARLAEVDTESARIRDDARADAERIKEEMAARASEEADRIVGQGRQTLDASRSRTLSELRGEVGSQSVELARRIVAADLSDDTRRGASVDGFLDQLEGMAGADDGSSSSGSRPDSGSSSGSRTHRASGSSSSGGGHAGAHSINGTNARSGA